MGEPPEGVEDPDTEEEELEKLDLEIEKLLSLLEK